MQIIISDDAKSAITDIYDYSYNNSNLFFKVHEKELFDFFNQLFI